MLFPKHSKTWTRWPTRRQSHGGRCSNVLRQNLRQLVLVGITTNRFRVITQIDRRMGNLGNDVHSVEVRNATML